MSRDKERRYYWAGNGYDETCNCGLTQSCDDTDYACNCDMRDQQARFDFFIKHFSCQFNLRNNKWGNNMLAETMLRQFRAEIGKIQFRTA